MPANHPKIGHLIDGPAFRDAIHIAVAPCVAEMQLNPGQRVALLNGKAYSPVDFSTCIGIVDPFLTEYVRAGDSFWLFLFPDTITSLRHEWTHPAFEPESTITADMKAAAREWLENFIVRQDWPPYDTVIRLFTKGRASRSNDDYDENYSAHISSTYVSFYGEMGHGELPPEFWTHLEIVTGRKFPHHPRSFSCSC